MIRIIPAIDIIDGQCVRLTQGDFEQKKVYHSNPLEVAKKIEAEGITHLHVVDLDGAKQKKIINHKTLEKITKHTNLKVDFGGGLQSNEDLKIAFESGACQITGGSIAIKNPLLFHEWIEVYGAERIILGADVKDEKIAVAGWQEVSEVSIYDFVADYLSKGLKYVFCTDVSKDGLLQGPSFLLYQKLKSQFPNAAIIASGGISSTEDVQKLNEMGIFGAIIGKAYYEGKIRLEDLQQYYQ